MASNIVTPEIVAILTYLLPGLVASATFYELTSHPKPSIFERVVQALIFTALAQLIADQLVQIFRPAYYSVSLSPESWHTALSVLVAVLLALVVTYVSNNDVLHRILRRLCITKETSHPSEWYSAFARKDPRYVVLHLDDTRRLYGWPEEWPSRADQGHFRLAEPTWLDEKNAPIESTVVDILIPADQVRMVEFLPEYETDEGG